MPSTKLHRRPPRREAVVDAVDCVLDLGEHAGEETEEPVDEALPLVGPVDRRE